MASDEDLTMIRKFWARSFLVVALFGAAMPVSAAEITSPAKQAYITDFATGKVLFSKDADAPMMCFQRLDRLAQAGCLW